jgi:hypothetical protein
MPSYPLTKRHHAEPCSLLARFPEIDPRLARSSVERKSLKVPFSHIPYFGVKVTMATTGYAWQNPS